MIPPAFTYLIACIAEAWHYKAKSLTWGMRDASGWFFKKGYYLQGLDTYMWVKLLSVELCFFFLAWAIWIGLKSIERRFNLKGQLEFYKTYVLGILAWCILDLFFWLYDYKTGDYSYVYIIVEVLIYVLRTICIHRNNPIRAKNPTQ